MKMKIASVFYDKTIDVLSNATLIDSEGGINYTGVTVTNSFNANVNFANCKRIQEDYGIDYDIDISITTDINNILNINDIIMYDNLKYVITDVLKHDTHVLMVGKKWE